VLLRHLGIPSGLCLELRCSIGLQIPLQEQLRAGRGRGRNSQVGRGGGGSRAAMAGGRGEDSPSCGASPIGRDAPSRCRGSGNNQLSSRGSSGSTGESPSRGFSNAGRVAGTAPSGAAGNHFGVPSGFMSFSSPPINAPNWAGLLGRDGMSSGWNSVPTSRTLGVDMDLHWGGEGRLSEFLGRGGNSVRVGTSEGDARDGTLSHGSPAETWDNLHSVGSVLGDRHDITTPFIDDLEA
jgi:hypothetical protein